MKTTLSALLLLALALPAHAQQRIDTLYYDQSGHIAADRLFADYYRIALYPEDTLRPKPFKDFYMTGEVKRTGNFLSIDSRDDRNSRFDREVVTYFRNGRVHEQAYYADGHMEGEYRQYDDQGRLRVQAFYLDGRLTGLHHTYGEDGTCRTVEYDAGHPVHNYYTLADSTGRTLKLRLSNDQPLWESPATTERFIDYRDGMPWEVYCANGLTVAMSHSIVRDYGKWHRIDLIVANDSTVPITFTPEEAITACSTDKDDRTATLEVWPYEAFRRKVNRTQMWTLIAIGVSEALPAVSSGYETTTSTHYDGHGHSTTHTTTTYGTAVTYTVDPAAAYRVAALEQSMDEERQVIKMGYLKKNTIYPGETVSGFVLVKWERGERVAFDLRIEDATYHYEWLFDRKHSYLPE